MEKENSMVEDYVQFVQEVIEKYSKHSQLINQNSDTITPQTLNYVLAQYMPTNTALIAEYQRAKIENTQLLLQYEEWYDEKFVQVRQSMIDESEAKTAKISVKEIETQLRVETRAEYYYWQKRLKKAEFQERFLLRLVDQYKKFDMILTTISRNMQSEMLALSIENRMNQTGKENKVRRVKLED